MPSEPATVRRNVVRLIVLDGEDQVLLLRICDQSNPAFGTIWELPGGGIEPGETSVQAAMRELREEAGLEVEAARIGCPTWHRQVSYTYRRTRWQQDESVMIVRLVEASPAIRASLRQGVENEDVLEARWWSVQQIVASGERFYPRSLPALLPELLRGATIEEQPEQWP